MLDEGYVFARTHRTTGSHMKRPIDHVVFAGQDLDALQESFEAAGFETAYGGTHSNGITHMHLIGFGNRSYIELISKNDPDGTAPWWNEQIDSDAGATAWSITVDDIAERSEELAAEGIEIEGPTKFSRDRPDGKSVEWELTIVGGRPQGTPLPMLEMDHTPLEWRVDITTDPETTGIMGLTDVVIGTDRFDETVDAFEEFYDGAEAEIRREEPFGARSPRSRGRPRRSPNRSRTTRGSQNGSSVTTPCCHVPSSSRRPTSTPSKSTSRSTSGLRGVTTRCTGSTSASTVGSVRSIAPDRGRLPALTPPAEREPAVVER